MSDIFEEAIADVKKIQEVATHRAEQRVLEALAPRINRLVEEEMLADDLAEDEEIKTEDVTSSAMDAISLPDEEGKVTLDLDKLAASGGEDNVGDVVATAVDSVTSDEDEMADSIENEINAVEEDTDEMLFSALDGIEENKTAKKIKTLKNEIAKFKGASPLLQKSPGFIAELKKINSVLENTYDRIQESIEDSDEKSLYNECLESLNSTLTNIQENIMNNRRLVEEEELDSLEFDVDMEADEAETDEDTDAEGELTLKLTGLPDDVELEDVGVDLIAADAADEEDADMDMSGDDDDDDEVVEIDENMLRHEIARMKKLRESEDCDVPCDPSRLMPFDGPGDGEDFGGGDEEGDAFEKDITTEGSDCIEGLEEMDDEELEEMYNEARRAHRIALKRNAKKESKILRQTIKESRSLLVKRHKLNEARRLNSRVKARKSTKLSVSNLNNMKLRCENAILKSSLPTSVKRKAISKINECKSGATLKAVYGQVRNVAKKSKLSEGKVLGSSSRPTRSAQSSTLNEGVGESQRWARLAGLTN